MNDEWRDGLPGVQQIRAALKVATLIDENGVHLGQLRDSYPKVPTGGLLSTEDLESGEALLERLGLLVRSADDENRATPDARLTLLARVPEDQGQALLLSVALDDDPPAWLSAATAEGELRPELVSDRDRHILEQLEIDPDERERILLNEGSRVDPGALKALGDVGEEHVYRTYRRLVQDAGGDPDDVIWVARVSDRLGYDVSSPRHGAGRNRCEVKTTRTLGLAVTVYLSRHEAETGIAHRNEWALVVCRVDSDNQVQGVGWTRIEALVPMLPEDRDEAGRWSVTELTLPWQSLEPGLPD